MNRRDFTRRAMFGLFGGAAAVTTTQAQKKGRFPQKNRFRHKTGLGFYDFAWSGWHQVHNQTICCAQWYAVPVDPRGAEWAHHFPLPGGFYASTTGTAGPMLSPSYVVDLTLMEGQPLITTFSTPKQKADSRFESYDRLMKMIEDFAASPAEPPLEEPPLPAGHQYYTIDEARRLSDLPMPMKPGKVIPTVLGRGTISE